MIYKRENLMSLTSTLRKQYKSIAHHLNPVVIVGDNGINEGTLQELERALNDHELIKVKLMNNDRDKRAHLISELCEALLSEKVQTIGKMVVLFRKNPKANPKLSNIMRLGS